MKRKSIHLRSSNDKKRAIYIDEENANTIHSYLLQDDRHRKKFNHIIDIILGGLRNTSLYDKEDINQKCKNITAMKLFKGQENDRIYCKEITKRDKTFVVIVVELMKLKKQTRLTHREKNIIEKIAGYEYSFDE